MCGPSPQVGGGELDADIADLVGGSSEDEASSPLCSSVDVQDTQNLVCQHYYFVVLGVVVLKMILTRSKRWSLVLEEMRTALVLGIGWLQERMG